jgi:5'-3' exoribonuclease 1
VFVFDDAMAPYEYPSPWPDRFPPIHNCCTRVDEFAEPPETALRKGVLPGVSLDHLQGFPTLSNIPHTAELTAQYQIDVFGTRPRDPQCIAITVSPEYVDAVGTAEECAARWLGKNCFFNWPHLKEGLVVGVSDSQTKWTLNGDIEKVSWHTRAILGAVHASFGTCCSCRRGPFFHCP